MNRGREKESPVMTCAWAALIAFLVTAVIPILFFTFPGPDYMPFRYEHMWAVAEALWGPLRIVEKNLDGLFSSRLRQNLNPYFFAPVVNGPFAFAVVCCFLMARSGWRKRSCRTSVGTDLHSVTEQVEKVRDDFPGALHG